MKAEVAGIYVISLDSRPDRWELFQRGMQAWTAAFGCPPERFPAVAGVLLSGYGEKPWFTPRVSEQRKKSWGGKAGCILSHRRAIQRAADQQWDNVLIVEDDAFMTGEMAQVWAGGLQSLVAALPADWSAIYLCTTTPIAPCRAVAEYQGIRLVETTGAFGTVAYLLNGRVFGSLLRELPEEEGIWRWVARHKTIDRWFSRNLMRFGRVYLFAPSIAGHHSGESDITMSPGTDGLLDFTLRDIRYVRNGGIFALYRALRRADNALRSGLAVFREGGKRCRGL